MTVHDMISNLQPYSTIVIVLFVTLSLSLQRHVLGLPVTTVLIRQIRPYGNILLSCFWIYIRFILPLQYSSSSSSSSFDSIPIPPSIGLLNFLLSSIQTIFHPSPRAWLLLDDILGYLIVRCTFQTLSKLRYYATSSSLSDIRDDILNAMFEWSKLHIPSIRRKLQQEELKMKTDLEHTLKDPNRTPRTKLPPEGLSADTLLEILQSNSIQENKRWQDGKISGAIYNGEASHTSLLHQAYALYSWSNPLHPDIWPSVNRFEAEICAMTADLLNGGDCNVVGSLTSGGTESIMLAVRSALHTFGRNRGIRNPRIVACVTAHAALDKACDLMSIDLIRLPSDEEFRLDPVTVERYVTSDTILIYASAPNFPQGVMDDIESLSELAWKYRIGLHVDCCLGGFVLPFAKLLGCEDVVPRFDFACRGVTSLSCDTHKFGYASKGTSVVLYRNKDLRRAQYFSYAKWTGGLYSTPTLAGSRSGALIACAWTSLLSIGRNGYLSRTQSILTTTRNISRGISTIPHLVVMAPSQFKSMIVAFSSETLNIYDIGDEMKSLGWNLNSLQHPPCLHICVTVLTCGKEDSFLKDLRGVVDKTVRNRTVEDGSRNGQTKKKEGNAAIYGMAGSMPAGPVEELLKCYTDVMLTP